MEYRTKDGIKIVEGKDLGSFFYGEGWRAATPAEVAIYQESKDSYKSRRLVEYAGIGDQLDVIWKQFNQMRLSGIPLIQEADDMLGDILSIKKNHPKPDSEG